jgi:thioredoxin 1
MKSITLLRSLLIGAACLSMPVANLRAAEVAPGAETQTALPLLVDLGAGKCIPCKLMAPILAELEKEYAGHLKVVFIDVWKNRAEGERYGVLIIPTQIFFDATGKERFRHEGFMAKKDILAKWEELGVPLNAPPAEKKG